jgi:heptosyltransferase-2
MRLRPAILALRGGAVGDFILTLPVLQALREAWPEARIELAGYPEIAGLAQLAGWADRVVSLHQARIARLYVLKGPLDPELREVLHSFDRIVACLHDPEGSVARNLAQSGVRNVLLFSPVGPTVHAADHLLAPLARELGLEPAPAVPCLPLPDALREDARARLRALGLRTAPLAVHPGSGSSAKIWPLDRFLELAERRRAAGRETIFLTGEADAALEPTLEAFSRDGGIPWIRNEPLASVAALLSACGAYLGNDSGPTHLAAALGVPTVAIFGPTDPAIWGPRGRQVRIVRADSGRMEDLTVDRVEAALRESGA